MLPLSLWTARKAVDEVEEWWSAAKSCSIGECVCGIHVVRKSYQLSPPQTHRFFSERVMFSVFQAFKHIEGIFLFPCFPQFCKQSLYIHTYIYIYNHFWTCCAFLLPLDLYCFSRSLFILLYGVYFLGLEAVLNSYFRRWLFSEWKADCYEGNDLILVVCCEPRSL